MLDRISRIVACRSSKSYLNYLRKKGISIGKGTFFFAPIKTYIDTQRPWMVEIGEYCKITSGVIILQHDYSRSVLRRAYGEIIGESKKTVIGDNCFLGMNSIILMGTQIGDNVIVGAGSVVSGEIPSNVVIAGNPAKIIKSLDEYYNQRKSKYYEEAKQTFIEFKNKFNREPTINEMGSFWSLFLPKDLKEIKNNNIFTNLSGDDEEQIINDWINSQSLFKSYDEFKKSVYLK